ncbi:ATP-dependent RNA helicase DDX51 isoform X2 [Gadus macrocephalus]|uniref:ATP-dependent RNA helicase DDX51 isoform X2 n=1 Tax=Gadus macrocephalus TaxID=80720 RepID=UPI0028CBA42A|nr:ATP-dependent RNA helicase DDX51 isoform X2 [Gadus macrocephalus]
MSLFVVNRYLGDEEEESDSIRESHAQRLLARLQSKAKEREQRETSPKRAKKRPAAESGESGEPKQKTDKPKKKKVKPTVTPEVPEPVKEVEPAGDKKKDGKKKKKKNDRLDDAKQITKKDEGGVKEKGGEMQKENQENQEAVVPEAVVPTGFTVLGGFENKVAPKVHRVLPQWLAQPDVILRDIRRNLVAVGAVQGLSPATLKKLQDNGVTSFFPVQAEVVPAVLECVAQGLLVGRGGYRPRDICVSAPTGSGKTLAFVVPLVQALIGRVVCEVRALVVLPTKELAQQVCKVCALYAEGSGLKVVMLCGQKSFAAEQTSLAEQRGGKWKSLADIVVATPGRLVDHINKTPGFRLDLLRFLVIDEADRMIDSMHHSWLGQVTKAVFRAGSGSEGSSVFRRSEPTHITAASLSPPQMPLQKLLFSATLTMNPEKLQQLGLHQPRLFSSTHSGPAPSAGPASAKSQERFNFPEGLTEYFVPCTLSKKPLLILHYILHMKFCPLLCFTNSRQAAHRLFLLVRLFGGVEAAEFSSRLSTAERKHTLRDFQHGKIQLLICTDAAARGIDIEGIKCVVNYDAPQYLRTYIHRIGRTARAGKAGVAFTFLLDVQRNSFLKMVEEAGSVGIKKHSVKHQLLKNMAPRYETTLKELASAIKDEKDQFRIKV